MIPSHCVITDPKGRLCAMTEVKRSTQAELVVQSADHFNYRGGYQAPDRSPPFQPKHFVARLAFG